MKVDHALVDVLLDAVPRHNLFPTDGSGYGQILSSLRLRVVDASIVDVVDDVVGCAT